MSHRLVILMSAASFAASFAALSACTSASKGGGADSADGSNGSDGSDGSGGTSADSCPHPGAAYVGCTSAISTSFQGDRLSATTQWTFGADGMPDAGETDADSNGTPESAFAYTYDAFGNRATERYTTAGDADPWMELARDLVDGDVQSIRYAWENGAPSSRVITYLWDGGKIVGYEDDADGDGAPEGACVVTWDTEGGLERGTWDCDFGGTVYAFEGLVDERGNTLRTRWDLDGSHVWYMVRDTTWTDDCQQVSAVTTVDEAIAGYDTWERVEMGWTYDADDRLDALTQDRIDADDGLGDQLWTTNHAYACD